MEIKTKRLKLIPCTKEILKGLIDENLFETTGQKISENWPIEDIKDALPIFLTWSKTGYTPLGWGMWLVVSIEENIVVGGAGFIGPADESNSVEIGYSIAPEFRRNGYTLEACTELINWAFSKGVKTINAKCEKTNIASIKLLEKLGMEFSQINEDGESEYFITQDKRGIYEN